ncbi:MAG: hypothetical protein ACFFB5_18470 [Promethearchaeota archaeon]
MDQHILHINNNGFITFGTILWMIAGISFFFALLFSIGLFQNLSLEGSSEVRLEILLLLMGILNATSISGSIMIVSSKKQQV